MVLSKTLLALSGLLALGLLGSVPAQAQTDSSASFFSKKTDSFTPPVLLDTVRTESDKLFVEIETPECPVIVSKARPVSALLTTRTLKYNGGTVAVPEGANLLIVSRKENVVTWQFYKATNPREWLHLGRPGVSFSGVSFYDKNGQMIPASPARIRIGKPITTDRFNGPAVNQLLYGS